MRLVDADALLKAFYRELDKAMLYGCFVKTPHELIKDAPTIDAVPVVRCKDCRNWSEMQNSAGACLRRGVIDGSWWTGTDSTDYCSFAERRDDEIDRR